MADAEVDVRLTELEGDEREFVRLARFLRRAGDAFGLALASYRDPVVARGLRERLRAELEAQRRVAEVVCVYDDDSADLVGRLAAASEGSDVVFVVGLDRLLLDSGGRLRSTAAITNLNLRRDELPERVAARVVLWVSEDGVRSLTEQAWDLVQVVLTTAQFEGLAKVPMPARGVEFDLPEWAEPAPEEERPRLEAVAEQGEKLFSSEPDAVRAGVVASSVAGGHAWSARYADAVDWFVRAAKLMERDRSLAVPVCGLYCRAAELMLVRGDASSALALAERAQSAFSTTNAKELVARASAARGDLPTAFRIWWELFEHHRRTEQPEAQAWALGELGELHRLRGDLDSALLLRREHQLPLLRSLEPGDARSYAIAKANAGVAEVLEQRGELVEALAIRQQQLPVFERLGSAREHARALARIADILAAQGDAIEADRIRAREVAPIENRTQFETR